jgi:ketosteroid isomerase-like protein
MIPALVCVLGMISQAVSPAPSAADRVELERLERVWNEAHERGDAIALDAMWAPELTVTVPGMAVMHKADSLAIWQSGRMRFERYATSALEFRVLGDAAIVTGRVERARLVKDRRIADDWQFTKVYQRQNGRWRVVAWHASESPKQ